MKDEDWMTEQPEKEPTCGDDLCVWADGTACYRFELSEMTWLSDDYMVIPFGTEEYDSICAAMGYA